MAEETTQAAVDEAARDVAEAAETLRQAAEATEETSKQLSTASDQALSLIDGINALSSAVSGGPSDFIYLLAIFILAIFVGYYVVWSVTPALHTPLMAVTNAISSVVIVGALIAVGANVVGSGAGLWSKAFGFLAVALASVNIFGGFLVTQRMLGMYKKKGS
ncbi:MAG: NAD(P) transhydrogenase subunit alpha [Parvularculaceae bacterium]